MNGNLNQVGARAVSSTFNDLRLDSVAATRALERQVWASHAPSDVLMGQAGLSLARWIRSLAPHARRILLLCGPGGNGGDGLYAAACLQEAGVQACVWLVGRQSPADGGPDLALNAACAAQVHLLAQAPDSTEPFDVVVDALLGIGARVVSAQALASVFEDAIGLINTYRDRGVKILAADVPTGLNADDGTAAATAVRADATLSLLTLKPGLFTGEGRRCAGDIWWDPLVAREDSSATPVAWLAGGYSLRRTHRWPDPGDHKGKRGDVLVVGGAAGMSGALWLAACAALGAGAGRIYVHGLGPLIDAPVNRPELMQWTPPGGAWGVAQLERLTVVCGCGGGQEVRPALPPLLAHSARLVLDADALNAVAADTQLQAQVRSRHARGRPTLLTPHPLEAARLLNCTVAEVQAHRLQRAQQLADLLQCVVVLKGSGTVLTGPGQVPRINPTGSATLASGGIGDVLAGWLGASWAQMPQGSPLDIACAAVWLHGHAGQSPPPGSAHGFQALDLIAHMRLLRDGVLNAP